MKNNNEKLDPNFIVGFVDAEGSFIISIFKNNKYKIGWRINPFFSIELHSKDLYLLKKIQSFFGVGTICVRQRDNQVIYTVSSIKDLTTKIIPFFKQYQLLTQKRADFELFQMVIEIVNKGEHLSIEGLHKILSIRASMNLGLTSNLKQSFPNIITVERPIINLLKIPDYHWVAGFVSGLRFIFTLIYRRVVFGVTNNHDFSLVKMEIKQNKTNKKTMTYLMNKIRIIIMPIALLLLFHFYFDSCLIFSIVPIYNVNTATATSIIVFGTNLTSTVGIKFTLKQLGMVQLAPYQYSVIIGLLLSDGWLRFTSSRSNNALLGFSQSAAHGEYFWFVFFSLSHYCSSCPVVRIRSRFEKENISLEFFTRSMPCMTEFHSLFYPNGVKIVPYNIYELLTPIALAHLIMGDGSVKSHGLIICTNSYSVQDVVRLMNVLIIRYRLECKIRLKKQNQKIEYMIYISQSSMPLLLNIVSPFMHSSMLYKLKSALVSSPSNRQKIEVFDKDTNQTTYYNSINEAAISLNCNHTSIIYNIKSKQKKPYKGRYVFKLL